MRVVRDGARQARDRRGSAFYPREDAASHKPSPHDPVLGGCLVFGCTVWAPVSSGKLWVFH